MTREEAFQMLQEAIQAGIPAGFAFGELYKMPSWYVPLEIYPAGYHCQKGQPLPFLSIAMQKSHLAVYHMGMYADPELYAWFSSEYEKVTGKKPDIGKSCIRFKKHEEIPFGVIGDLVARMTPQAWISLYESAFRKG